VDGSTGFFDLRKRFLKDMRSCGHCAQPGQSWSLSKIGLDHAAHPAASRSAFVRRVASLSSASATIYA